MHAGDFDVIIALSAVGAPIKACRDSAFQSAD